MKKTEAEGLKENEEKEIAAHAVPYGYRKDKNRGKSYVIDPCAAQVVRRIFQYKLMGYSNAAIKDKLNCTGIPCPLEYKKQKGMPVADRFQKNQQPMWHEQTILTILKNPAYAGDLALGKTQNFTVGGRRVLLRKKEEEFTLRHNHHQPIVSRFVYEAIRRVLEMDTKAAPFAEKVYLFSGFLYCGDCGQPMTRTRSTTGGRDYIYYICKGYKEKKGCTSHRVNEKRLTAQVLQHIRKRLEELERIKVGLDPVRQSEAYQWLTEFLDFGQAETLTRPLLSMFVTEIGVWKEAVQVNFTYKDAIRKITGQ